MSQELGRCCGFSSEQAGQVPALRELILYGIKRDTTCDGINECPSKSRRRLWKLFKCYEDTKAGNVAVSRGAALDPIVREHLCQEVTSRPIPD